MFTKRAFKGWVIIGGGGLGVLTMVLLLQYNEGKQSINTTELPSTIQISPEIRSQPVKSPPAINTPQQSAKTGSIRSEKRETPPTMTDVSDTGLSLDKEDTISSLVNSLSDEDIEVLEGLTALDLASDKEIEELQHKIVESMAEAEVIGPKMVELRSMVSKLDAARRYATSREEATENIKQVQAVIAELNALREQAGKLQAFLLDSELGDLVDRDKIEKLFEDVWSVKGLQEPPKKR